MITDLFLSTLMLFFVLKGINNPHIALCAVVWVDIVKPQNISFSFLAGKPLSLILTVFFFFSLLINLKKIKKPKSGLYFFLMPMFMLWITLATIYGEFQHVAWIKYDVAIKTLLFALFIPFVLTERKHYELFILVAVASFGMFITMAGVKSVLGGGGYGVSLIGMGGFMYSEGSTLATLSICLLPIFIHTYQHSLIKNKYKFIKYLMIFYGFCALLVLIGTQARTGLICLAAFVVLLLLQTKYKFRTILAICIIPLLLIPFVTDDWVKRMNTIDEGATSEKSALGRIVVWRWTLDYVAERPFFGGGFYAYLANAGVLHRYQKGEESEISQKGGKAFHNVFFEVLGETGYGGLVLFLGIILHTLMLNRAMSIKIKRNKDPTKEWIGSMCTSVNMSLMVYCVGGMFIGVAFYPWIYYLYGLSVSFTHLERQEL